MHVEMPLLNDPKFVRDREEYMGRSWAKFVHLGDIFSCLGPKPASLDILQEQNGPSTTETTFLPLRRVSLLRFLA